MITLDDVQAAARRIEGVAHRTPVITGRSLDEATGAGRILLKPENLQRVGAFKFRGAYNALSRLSPEQLARGVAAYSSGNHAQAVALAARELGSRAVIVMPEDTPKSKKDATAGYGAEIVTYDRYTGDRVAIGRQLADERGLALIPPYEHPHIIAGQGTVGLEILDQLEQAGAPGPARIVVPTGGGGLASGVALACPDAAIICVEPEGWDDMRRSLKLGAIVPVAADAPPTLCDALQTPRVSPITFAPAV